MKRVVISVDEGAGEDAGKDTDRDGGWPAPGADARVYGRALFDRLLADRWPDLLGQAGDAGLELALDLPAELQAHPWEAMHDGRHPLAAHPDRLISITRVLPTAAPVAARVTASPTVLFASGAKLTDPVILPGAMFLGLLRACESEGLAVARVAESLTLDALARRCELLRPDLVHLVAHGGLDEDGHLRLELAGEPATTAQLVHALLPGGHRPLAVVLSACHSASPASLAAALVAAGVPIVVAMDGEIGEQACRLFSRRLVKALLNGESVAEAAAHGRRAALLAETTGDNDPGARLDWARPTVFTAASLPESFRPIDPDPGRMVLRRARRLGLAQRPVYIGRRAIFEQVDTLFTGEVALLAATSEGEFSRLGATRLLSEIGFRLLQEGHVPLLLAPHKAHTAPRSLRAVVAEILRAAAKAAEQLELPPPHLETVAPGPGDPPRRAIAAFLDAPAPLRPDDVCDSLAADLVRLAGAAASLGPPFGPHTRVVVLAEALHLWLGALGWIGAEPPGLLDLLTPNGLGTPGSPVPVVATAALGQCAPLAAFKADQPGIDAYRFERLDPLPDDEATLGYQWVLLQPWHPDAHLRKTWVAAPGHDREALRETFGTLGGYPAGIADRLYDLVSVLTIWKHFVACDDEGAWREYARKHRLEP
ncbi:CHAT domain-containing protein [Nonomuraea sp. NBC_01738]|uniref:CHAT domain-containing protein n=1 Tax=Nonomuraea sp. NBC_01738 TaxID=2976003 RepID=UPI002E142582|nr:CHAT domain-containing protein [Nonomuraea sp. NBC_01738]